MTFLRIDAIVLETIINGYIKFIKIFNKSVCYNEKIYYNYTYIDI